MSLTSDNGGMVMPVGPMNGNGNGFGWGGDWSFWIIILFLFAFMGNGWNGFGGFNGGASGEVQRGFDQQAVMGGISGLTSAVSNGFANAEVSRCNAQANILQTLNANQTANNQAMNALAMSLQNCCCENRAATADLKYTVATEACADRNAVTNALVDVEALINSKTQMIMDKLCQQEIDALKSQNDQLRTQLNMVNLQASQADQTANILNKLNPAPIPAYLVANSSGCGNYSGCGCGA